jgi:hypothetical protein
MKRIKTLALALVIALGASTSAFADIPHLEGGVSGDVTLKAGTYNYSEVAWISGEPIVMTGTVTIPTTTSKTNAYKLSYNYELENTEKKATLSRKITYDVQKLKNEDVNQTTYKITIPSGGLKETYTVGSDVYNLGSSTINKSVLEDNTPAVDFYSGNVYTKRTFYRNGTAKANTGEIVIETNTDTLVGYKHRWGNSETQIINENITAKLKKSGSTTTGTDTWKGNVQIKMSVVEKEKFDYVKTDTQTISFRGGYIQIKQQENLLQYTYDMPTISGTTINEKIRNKGEKNIKKSAVLDSKPLIAPKLRDTTGHWAEKQILLTTSLELFSAESNFFAPDSKVTRKDFFKGLARVVEDIKPLTEEELMKRTRGVGIPSPYPDIDPKDPNISFYEFVKNNNMVIGENEDFLPDRPITRAEMLTAIINTLGIADMAPQPPYKTGFKDEASIPFWSKDAIYMANEIGLTTGYADGTIKPNQYVTRAEAAAMFNKLIDHIRETITTDYRDKLINR